MFYPLNDARSIGVTGGNRTLVDRSTICRLSHSATVTLGARSTSRTCLSGFSDRRLDRNGLPGEIGGRGGNRTLICWLQASGPPVERLPQNWLRAGELNATRMAYEASMTPVHLPALETWSGKLGSNQRPLDYRSSAQTALSFSRMEPRARFELAFPDYRSGASPPMLTGRVILEPMERIERSSVAYRATALPLSYIGWSQRGYSKPRPPRYECGALPLELLRRGASAENRTPLIGLAIRCPTNRPHPQKLWSGRR